MALAPSCPRGSTKVINISQALTKVEQGLNSITQFQARITEEYSKIENYNVPENRIDFEPTTSYGQDAQYRKITGSIKDVPRTCQKTGTLPYVPKTDAPDFGSYRALLAKAHVPRQPTRLNKDIYGLKNSQNQYVILSRDNDESSEGSGGNEETNRTTYHYYPSNNQFEAVNADLDTDIDYICEYEVSMYEQSTTKAAEMTSLLQTASFQTDRLRHWLLEFRTLISTDTPTLITKPTDYHIQRVPNLYQVVSVLTKYGSDDMWEKFLVTNQRELIGMSQNIMTFLETNQLREQAFLISFKHGTSIIKAWMKIQKVDDNKIQVTQLGPYTATRCLNMKTQDFQIAGSGEISDPDVNGINEDSGNEQSNEESSGHSEDHSETNSETTTEVTIDTTDTVIDASTEAIDIANSTEFFDNKEQDQQNSTAVPPVPKGHPNPEVPEVVNNERSKTFSRNSETTEGTIFPNMDIHVTNIHDDDEEEIDPNTDTEVLNRNSDDEDDSKDDDYGDIIDRNQTAVIFPGLNDISEILLAHGIVNALGGFSFLVSAILIATCLVKACCNCHKYCEKRRKEREFNINIGYTPPNLQPVLTPRKKGKRGITTV